MSASEQVENEKLIIVGKITTVFGVKGWVKVHSYTDPAGNITGFKPLFVESKQGWVALDINEFRLHGQGFIAHIKGVGDRDQAAAFCQRMLGIDREQLPVLDQGEYYWSDLKGLEVFSCYENPSAPVSLGFVKDLLETGANDVLVVIDAQTSAGTNKSHRGIEGEGAQTERLIPFLIDRVIKSVDLDKGTILVDWDPEF